MTASFPPIDREVVTGLRSGDEHALERVFRDHYVALTTEARAELDDPVTAPRVVERAFVRAWAERDRFQTPDDLESFLHKTVHEGAVRERSRQAALHRFEAFEGVHVNKEGAAKEAPPVSDAWAHVVAALHAPTLDPSQVSHDRLDRSRHSAAEHVAAVAKNPPWVMPVLLGAVLAVIVFGALWWVDRTSAEAAVDRALAASDVRILSSKPGQRATLTLGDGTGVVLGADSKLTVPARFGDNLRAVKLEGTATFNAASKGGPDFQVRAGNAVVTTTGTEFGVSAFPNEPVTVRVTEGQVSVKGGDDSRTVAAGSAVAVAGNGKMSEPAKPVLDQALGWMDGRLMVTGRPLRDVLPQVNRWYALKLEVKDPALLERPVTINAGLESSKDAINALESSSGLKFGYEGKTMVLRQPTAADSASPAKAAAKKTPKG
jgi:ferric-dicitrate binding protein FerR (iron transport regulator)